MLDNPFKDLVTYDYDLWDLNSISVHLDGNFIHLKANLEHSLLSTRELYQYTLLKRLFITKDKFINSCIEKFRARLIRDNEDILESAKYTKTIKNSIN